MRVQMLWLWWGWSYALHIEVSPLELCRAVDEVLVGQVVDVEHRYATDGTLERLVHVQVCLLYTSDAADE